MQRSPSQLRCPIGIFQLGNARPGGPHPITQTRAIQTASIPPCRSSAKSPSDVGSLRSSGDRSGVCRCGFCFGVCLFAGLDRTLERRVISLLGWSDNRGKSGLANTHDVRHQRATVELGCGVSSISGSSKSYYTVYTAIHTCSNFWSKTRRLEVPTAALLSP